MERGDNPLALYYFYDRVVLFYERELKPYPVGLRITNPSIGDFLKANSIYPVIVNKSVPIIEPEDFGNSGDTFLICKKTSSYSILVSIYEHIRNSFAHGRFSFHKYNEEEFISLTDISLRGGKTLTMVAQMPVRVLVGLVETLRGIIKTINL